MPLDIEYDVIGKQNVITMSKRAAVLSTYVELELVLRGQSRLA